MGNEAVVLELEWRRRPKGLAEIAKKTGLSCEQLYRSFSENGNATLKSTLAVMMALETSLRRRRGEMLDNN